MKRVLVIAMVIVATVAGASMAEAAVKKGKFTGTTSADDPVGLKVNKRGKVYAFFYEGVTLKCTDGDAFDTPTGASNRVQTPNHHPFKVTKRKWGIVADNSQTGFHWDVSAKFNRKGTKTAGTLTVTAKFNEQNQQDPSGSITCASGKLKFSARRPARRK